MKNAGSGASEDCHDPALDNPHASTDLSRGPECGGCKHLHYTATHGQHVPDGCRVHYGNNNFDIRQPHFWCSYFYVGVRLYADRYSHILRADIPSRCPTHSQAELFA